MIIREQDIQVYKHTPGIRMYVTNINIFPESKPAEIGPSGQVVLAMLRVNLMQT